MLFYKNYKVRKDQLALLTRDGELQQVLTAGDYRYWDPLQRIKLTLVELATPLVESALAEQLRNYHPDWVAEHCMVMDLAEDEVGLRYEHQLLVEILPPATRRLYWKGMHPQHLERISLRDSYQLAPDITARLSQPKLRNPPIQETTGVLLAQVPAYHVGVLRVDGEVQELLSPGLTAYWRFNRDIQVELVDTRLQVLEVSGQEILTRDKVNLRLNLAANWHYTDVLSAFGQLAKPVDHLYRELQFGLREAVGTRTLDELLENKQVIDEVVSTYLAQKLRGYGIEVASLGVKDIVLPGDMKVILARVVEAEKLAQANVIRRREETAATRSLLNTAKVMENNPVALRLKELETLERVAERINNLSVFGGLDQVMNGLVQIKGA